MTNICSASKHGCTRRANDLTPGPVFRINADWSRYDPALTHGKKDFRTVLLPDPAGGTLIHPWLRTRGRFNGSNTEEPGKALHLFAAGQEKVHEGIPQDSDARPARERSAAEFRHRPPAPAASEQQES